ncbi:MAG: ABC transporter substrate-binding protein [Desulfobacteraceae bacterium]|nr:ABC transporter substrate-binding protein [Desulfobacteraceae bacterium]
MEKNLNLRIGHLKIVDHLILGYSVFRLKSNDDQLHHSTLENIPMNSWEQISDGLRQKEIHGAFITAPLAMDLFAAGLDISFLMFVHRSGSLMVKNKKAHIKKLGDLKGKTILIPHELSVQHLLLHKLLSTINLNIGPAGTPETNANQIVTEPTNPFLMPQMLENDEEQNIGAYMVAEPYGSQAIAKGVADKLCTSNSLWKDHPCCGFVIQADLESSHKEAIEELVLHFLTSAQHLNTQIDEKILGFAQNFLNQDQEIVKQALFDSGVSFNPQKLLIDKEELDIIQTYMTDTMGVMSQTIDLDAFLNFAYGAKAISEIQP